MREGVASPNMGPFHDGWTEADVTEVINRGDPVELAYVPIVVGLNAPDFGRLRAEAICLSLMDHPNEQVRSNAALGLGHIGRTCGEVSTDLVLPALERMTVDPQAIVRGAAEDALGDIRMFARK